MPKTPHLPLVPRWARIAAATAALTTVPSGLWRIAIAVGLPVGLAPSEYDTMGAPGWGSLCLIVLTVLAELLSYLTLGLVRPWGEVWPSWLPWPAGRPVPVRVAVGMAGFGALATNTYAVLAVGTWLSGARMDGPDWGNWLFQAAYAPLVLWGPLLTAVTVHYYRRRTGRLGLGGRAPAAAVRS
ncbi:hypothetical protein [Streptomyces lichenis]|uniref:DUF3995 domain-containing protein n=1 Tax=Streptomyces lichenis TaxID=2306967 RepID=A0ABT0IIW3_9ACTN|nr:hypothetical protein [Streptomyces lichenis]MCK8681275.1 hypothetical protein [Streptomyces lichenis]